MTHRVVIAASRDGVDRDELAQALDAMPGGGIYVRDLDTGDGRHAVVVSDRAYSKAEAEAAYQAAMSDVDHAGDCRKSEP